MSTVSWFGPRATVLVQADEGGPELHLAAGADHPAVKLVAGVEVVGQATADARRQRYAAENQSCRRKQRRAHLG